jgi:prevent-host-death family protein
MATTVNVHEAKTHLSKLLARVEAGEQVTISRAGKPIARIVPLNDRPARRVPGRYAGKIIMHDDFDDQLPEFEEYT